MKSITVACKHFVPLKIKARQIAMIQHDLNSYLIKQRPLIMIIKLDFVRN